ncbi:MAG: DNA replication/repair protein RecF [Parvibaculaceae bacterium]
MPVCDTKALKLRRLTLTDFRNYARLRVEADGMPVVLCGPNGAGKTNLLEAISLLAPGRGLRGVAFEDLARRGNGATWAVAGDVEGPIGAVQLGTGWRREPEGLPGPGTASGRTVRIEGLPQKGSGALGQHVRALWLTPAMDRLFTGPAADRRRFLDRLVMAFDPEHGSRILAFEKALKERNRLLTERRPEAAWLDGIEQQAAESGVAVAAARLAAVSALSAFLGEAQARAQGNAFPWAEIRIEGDLEMRLSEAPAVQVEDEYRRRLRESRGIDQQAGRTTAGPHRSDLVTVHGPKGAEARFCSTGEQKALLVGIVLAHARAVRSEFEGWAPLLLLDEVAAHLDEEHRAGLFAAVGELGCQAWMTGTDAAMFRPLQGKAEFWRLDEGVVARQEA